MGCLRESCSNAGWRLAVPTITISCIPESGRIFVLIPTTAFAPAWLASSVIRHKARWRVSLKTSENSLTSPRARLLRPPIIPPPTPIEYATFPKTNFMGVNPASIWQNSSWPSALLENKGSADFWPSWWTQFPIDRNSTFPPCHTSSEFIPVMPVAPQFFASRIRRSIAAWRPSCTMDVTCSTSPPVRVLIPAPMPPANPMEWTEFPTTSSPGAKPLACKQYISFPERPVTIVIEAPSNPAPYSCLRTVYISCHVSVDTIHLGSFIGKQLFVLRLPDLKRNADYRFEGL